MKQKVLHLLFSNQKADSEHLMLEININAEKNIFISYYYRTAISNTPLSWKAAGSDSAAEKCCPSPT